MRWQTRLAAVLACIIVIASAPGCGGVPAKVRVTGKIMKNGQPLIVGKTTKITLSLAPVVKAEGATATQTYPAIVTPSTGAYTIEVPPGTYTVRCIIMDMEANEPMPTGPPQTIELIKNQQLDIDVTAK